MIATNLRASSAPCGRNAKPKNFPYLFSFFGGGCGGSRQKMERKFLVLLRRFRLQNELSLFYHLSFYCVAHFSVFAARRGASSRRLVVAWYHVASILVVVTQRIWVVLGTNKSVCACPARPVRAQIPAILKKHYKTARIASLNTSYRHNTRFYLHNDNHFYLYVLSNYYRVCSLWIFFRNSYTDRCILVQTKNA